MCPVAPNMSHVFCVAGLVSPGGSVVEGSRSFELFASTEDMDELRFMLLEACSKAGGCTYELCRWHHAIPRAPSRGRLDGQALLPQVPSADGGLKS